MPAVIVRSLVTIAAADGWTLPVELPFTTIFQSDWPLGVYVLVAAAAGVKVRVELPGVTVIAPEPLTNNTLPATLIDDDPRSKVWVVAVVYG